MAQPSAILDRVRRYLAMVLLAAAIVIGGGGGPLLDLIVELIAIALLVVTLIARPGYRAPGVRLATLAAVLIALVPLAQLIPLPAAIWRALPGREIAIAVRDALGAGHGAFPLSLDPEATWRSALYLPAGYAMFFAVLPAPLAERRNLLLLAVAGIAASMVAGTLQVTGGESFYLYQTPHRGNAVGFLMNRNHQATLLLVGVALLPGCRLPAQWRTAAPARSSRVEVAGGLRDPRAWTIAILMLLFTAAVITTTSRQGMALAPLVLIVGLARTFPRLRSTRWGLLAVALLVVLAAAFLLLTNDVARLSIERFAAADQDGRMGYWADTIVAIGQFWPAGAGLGTFVPVYKSVESLDTLTQYYVNHAHNEYLELTLELGVLALPAVAAYLAAMSVALRQPVLDEVRRQRVSACVAIAVILAHSCVDYPLRTLTLMAVFGLIHALLFLPCPSRQTASRPQQLEPL